MAEQIDRSLKRLKVDFVDLVQLHSCSKDILQKGEVVEALQQAKKAGKTRFIGYSGDGSDAVLCHQNGCFRHPANFGLHSRSGSA